MRKPLQRPLLFAVSTLVFVIGIFADNISNKLATSFGTPMIGSIFYVGCIFLWILTFVGIDIAERKEAKKVALALYLLPLSIGLTAYALNLYYLTH